MDFCLLLKIWTKILVKIWVKTWAVNKAKNFWIILNNLLQMQIKLLQKEQFKNQGTDDQTGNKINDKNSQKFHHRIVKIQLQMNITETEYKNRILQWQNITDDPTLI